MLVPLTVNDFIDRARLVYGDRVAVVDEPDQPAGAIGPWTYDDLSAVAQAQSAALEGLDVPVRGRVAIVSHNSARLLASFFGVSGSGRVLVPINFRLTPAEISYIEAHSGAETLFADPDLRHVLDEVSVRNAFVLGECDDEFFLGRDLQSRGPAMRTRRPPSTTPQARRHAQRAFSSRTATCGSMP